LIRDKKEVGEQLIGEKEKRIGILIAGKERLIHDSERVVQDKDRVIQSVE
jgi:hypothetical protein